MTTRRCCNCMSELRGTDTVCPDCGYDNSCPDQPEQALPCGTVLCGRYLIGKMLGQGGFGITYIGYDYTLDTTVCIKEFFPAGGAMRGHDGTGRVFWSAGTTGTALKQGRETFVKEAQKAAKLRSLASVVKVWDVFDENDTSYIVMEYIKGVTLKDYLVKRNAVMSAEECLDLLLPVIRDLKGVHENGVVHRDISPDNLIIREDGKIMLLDLGAAKDLSKGSGQSSMMVAKKGFSPPEQYTEGMSIGPWTDVYAICATIYWCMTGKLLPEAMERMLGDTVEYPAGIPEVLKAVLQHGLELKPANRIKDMEELESDLETAIGKTTITETPPPKSKELSPALKALLAAAVILVIAIPAVKMMRQDSGSSTVKTEAVSLTNPMSNGKFSEWADRTVEEVVFLNTLEGAPSDAEDLSEAADKSVLGWKDGNKLYLAGEGGVRAPENCNYLFSDADMFSDSSKCWNKLTAVTNAEYFDLSQTKSTISMFGGCESLTSIDVSSWDTSRVTNMLDMFYDCGDLAELDVSSWDISNVTSLYGMFSGCGSLTSLDVSRWKTSKVTTLNSMFWNCNSLTSLDTGSWDTSKVSDMNSMFYGCSCLTDLDVSGWDTSKVTDISFMFNDCTNLKEVDVKGWDTSRIPSLNGLFSGCSSLTGLDVSGWDTSNVKEMSAVFMNCSGLKELDVSGWNTSNVTNMGLMFWNCISLRSLDVSKWDTSIVTNMHGMFWNCSNLTDLDVSGWDTSGLADKDEMFKGTRWENDPPF